MKKFLEKILAFFAKRILKKYKPRIIGLTGSVGKTSAKEAVFLVLNKKYSVRQNIKNYNTELGLPLTVIGAKSGGKNFFKWLAVFFQALSLIIIRHKNYPQILVLEMGADHPGDIGHLVDIAPCEVGVVTAVSASHLEFFGDLNGVKKEKEKIVSHLKKENLAVLNFDDEPVREMKKNTKAKVVTYGFSEGADVLATDLMYGFDGEDKKPYLTMKLHHQGSIMPLKLAHCLARTHVYSALIAVAVGFHFGVPLMELVEILKEFIPPKGRMNLIPGIKHAQIIDDTYNSSPKAALAALHTLSELPASGKKIAVLGDMLELGSESVSAHSVVGAEVASLNLDLLITVGERARDIARGAEANGLSKDYIFIFSDTKSAGLFLQERMGENDLVLIKASQGMRLEKIVKEVMAEPLRAKELLVRQDEDWLGK